MNKSHLFLLIFIWTCLPGYSQVVEPEVLRWDSTELVRQSQLFYANSTLVHVGLDNTGKFISELDDSMRVLNRQSFFADHTIAGVAYVNGNYMLGGTREIDNVWQTLAMTIVKPTGFPVASGRANHEGTGDFGYRFISLADSGGLLVGSAITPSSNRNIRICRFNSESQVKWEKSYAISDNCYALDVIETDTYDFYVTGASIDNLTQSSSTFLMKLASNGDSLWAVTYGGELQAKNIFEVSESNILIAGTRLVKNSYNQRIQPLFSVTKVDSLGIIKWEKSYERFLPDSTINIFSFRDVYHTSDDGAILLGTVGLFNGSLAGNFPYLLKVDAEGEYQWHKLLVPPAGGEAIGLQVIELVNGTYGVSAERSSNSPSSVYGSLILLGPDGTFTKARPEQEVLRLTISPNPASDHAVIRWTQSYTGQVEVRVLDVQGRLILRKQSLAATGPAEIKIPMHALANGAYLVEVISDGIQGSGKLVKVGV